MKLVVLLLVVLPLTMAMSLQEERLRRQLFGGLLDFSFLREAVQGLLDTLGSDPSEEICEGGCHSMVMGDETALLHSFCTPLCQSFQMLVGMLDLTPDTPATP